MKYAQRKRNRLSSWDYSTAAVYFVTFCTQSMKPLLGKIIYTEKDASVQAFLRPTRIGSILTEEICRLAADDARCEMHAYVVMPNHVHMLVEIRETSDSHRKRNNLSKIVARLKQRVTYRARKESPGIEIWQRSFHDHVVRSDEDLARIYEYIENNPRKWALDRYYTE